MPSSRSSHRSAMAVTDWHATTLWPKPGTVLSRGKSRVLAMLAAKRRLRVAPVPPQAADLTRPARGAGIMPGRDEGTGASIEPRNNHKQASGLAVTITTRIQSFAQWWVRLNYASHTEIRILPWRCGPKVGRLRLSEPLTPISVESYRKTIGGLAQVTAAGASPEILEATRALVDRGISPGLRTTVRRGLGASAAPE